MHPSIVRPIRLMRPFWDINGAKSVIWRIRGRTHTPGRTAWVMADMRKSRDCRFSWFAKPRHTPPFISKKLLLAPSNAQNFLAARPPSGARGASGPRSGTPSRTNPPVGLEGSSPTSGVHKRLTPRGPALSAARTPGSPGVEPNSNGRGHARGQTFRIAKAT